MYIGYSHTFYSDIIKTFINNIWVSFDKGFKITEVTTISNFVSIICKNGCMCFICYQICVSRYNNMVIVFKRRNNF